MFHILNTTSLYDIINETKIELELYKDKERQDMALFLEDVSNWMDANKDKVADNYLPFSVLSVGVIPIQVSAFLYGIFIGKALEKHKLKIRPVITKVDKDTMLKEIDSTLDKDAGFWGKNLRDIGEEGDKNGRNKKG